MGRGLQIEPTGQHVAFCAGTGVLVFIDLVSHLLVRNCFEYHQREVPDQFDQMKSGFKFHLYVSFQNREQSIGLDICEALVKINQKLGLNNFKLTVRLSEVPKGQPPAGRWSPEYIESEMM